MHFKRELISDILYFDSCSDFEITLYAKLCYALSGTKFKDFLFWQVDKMIEAGDFIDIQKEHTAWLISLSPYYDEEKAICETENEFKSYKTGLEWYIKRYW